MGFSLDIKTFLSQTMPFNRLDSYCLETFANKIDIAYYKKDEIIADAGSIAQSFYIVAKGIVCDGASYLEEKDCFDLDALLSGTYSLTYSAQEESLLYKIEKNEFLELLHSNPQIERYFLQSAAKKLEQRNIDSQNYMIKKIKEIGYQKPIFVDFKETIFATVEKMSDANLTFALVNFDDNIGIVTDSDFRKKVILKKLSYDASIGDIATKCAYTIDEQDFLFNAMLAMTRHNVKRLVVKNENNVIGVLQDIDILSAFSSQTQFLAQKIYKAKTNEELKEILNELNIVIQRLLNEGIKARHICKLVSELNLQIFQKLWDELADDEIKENVCLVISGAEGRGEQILRTDQDNMLIIKDGFVSPKIKDFADKFHDSLSILGFPECPGGIMLNNDAWQKEIKSYKSDIFEALNHPSADGFLLLPILMDMKYVAGSSQLVDELKDYLSKHLNSRILSHLANASFAFETPLNLFNAFILSKKEHDGELDIKKGGIFAIVNGMRVLAYEKCINETNTFAKLKELVKLGIIDKEFAQEITEAYSFLLEIRLKERLYKISIGQEPNNYINPSRLSKLERDLLKDVFKIVDNLKKFIHAHFKLGYVS